MRTTLTLEEDVSKALQQLAEERSLSFKELVNSALRAGLSVLLGSQRGQAPHYVLEPVSLGTPRLPNLDNIGEVLAIAEGEEHR